MDDLVTTRLGRGRQLALAGGWFGMNFHWLPISFILLQAQVAVLMPRNRVAIGIGIVGAAGGVLAVVVPPLVGSVSDRLTTRYGRRRPIIVLGLAGNLVGLLVMGTASSFAALLAGYLVIQLFNGAATAAYAGLIPDVVPDGEVGGASGLLGAGYNLGGILGVVTTFVFALGGHVTLAYLVIAPVLILAFVPVFWAARGEGLVPLTPRRRRTAAEFLAPLWSGSFAWVLLTRFMMTAGVAVISFFLSPFFSTVLHIPNASAFTSLWLLVVFICGAPFGYLGGALSDRLGRKVFVYASSLVQVVIGAFVVIVLPSSVPLVLVLGGLFGVGYGLYYAVDWALAVDTLPDAADASKDMGLFHTSFVLPQTIVPLIGGALIDGLGGGSKGYRAIFVIAIICFVLGTVLVRQVKPAPRPR
ncbi:MAG: MFS transporter [Candidatus Dormibacteraeota bacterium]|nr:MFS transporter [Candidatus Dormibacteraeota bacterium]